MNRQSAQIVVWNGIFIVILCISLVAIIFTGRDLERVLYYYPNFMTGNMVGEHRYIPRRQNLSDRIHEYLSEYLLGPQIITSRNLFFSDLLLDSLFVLDNGVVVINYSASLIQTSQETLILPNQILEVVNNALKQNFPQISEVRFLIEGQEL